MSEIASDAAEMCCTICMMITCNTISYNSHSLSKKETQPCDSRAPCRTSSRSDPAQLLPEAGPGETARDQADWIPVYRAKFQSLKHAM